jgi:hypothetical protein
MIKTILFFIYLAAIVFSAVMAILCRRSIGKRNLAVMVPYLSLVSLMEIFVYIDHVRHWGINATFIYNLYKIITVLTFAFIYYCIPFMKASRKLIAILTACYLLAAILSYSFWISIYALDTYLTLFRGFVITFFAVLFLHRFFYLDDGAEEKFWRPVVWITTGIAAFYPVISITASFSLYLFQHDATLFGLKLYQTIPQVMSIFMYGCFSYAFYLCRKKN